MISRVDACGVVQYVLREKPELKAERREGGSDGVAGAEQES